MSERIRPRAFVVLKPPRQIVGTTITGNPPDSSHSPDHSGRDQFWIMGRTRTKSKNQRHIPTKTSTTQSSSAPSTTAPSVSALISKAQSIIEQCDYDLAGQFIQRILQISPKNVEAREMLGIVQLETGLVQEARKVSSSFFIPFLF